MGYEARGKVDAEAYAMMTRQDDGEESEPRVMLEFPKYLKAYDRIVQDADEERKLLNSDRDDL
jgi:hypothetical protein